MRALTSLRRHFQEQLQHIVISMCGQLQDDLSLTNFVVAKDVLAEKYKVSSGAFSCMV